MIASHRVTANKSCINRFFPSDIKWFRLEKYYTGSDSTFMEQPLFYQYLYILLLCIIGEYSSCFHHYLCYLAIHSPPNLEFVAFHLGVHIAVRWLFRGRNSQSIRLRFFYSVLAFNVLQIS
jgi:hypothetical protein